MAIKHLFKQKINKNKKLNIYNPKETGTYIIYLLNKFN